MSTLIFLIGLLLSSISPAQSITYSSPGCNATGLPLDSTGHLNRTLPSGRTYLLAVPANYNASESHPVVLSFHGGKSSLLGHVLASLTHCLRAAGGTSANQEKLSQFSASGLQIANRSIIAAYPQGADNEAQNRTGVWYSAPYANSSVDDVSALIWFVPPSTV